MRKLTMTSFALFTALAFVATASAGDDKTKTKDKTTTTTTTTTTSTTTSKSGGGAAGTGGGATTTAATDAAGQSMEMPDPPKALLDQAKAMKGTWKCTGTMNDMQGNAMPAKGTIKWALDLDKMWVKGTLLVNKMKGQKRGYKATFMRTANADGSWTHVAIGNMGDWGWATTKGPEADGKITWEGEAHMGSMVAKAKDYEQPGEKKTMHLWGEMSMDGKNWMPGYDMTCKK